MRYGNPLNVLHLALAAATLRDLPNDKQEHKDWNAALELEKKMGREAAREHLRQHGDPMRVVETRPREGDVDVELFQQMWGSTALGYGGVGGSAMTQAYTAVITHGTISCVYFGGGRLAYSVDRAKLKPKELEAFQHDLAQRQLAGRRDAVVRYAALPPSSASDD